MKQHPYEPPIKQSDKATRAKVLKEIIVDLVTSEHPMCDYSEWECLLFAHFHKIITDGEWSLLKEFYM